MKNNTYHHGDLKNALIDAGITILKEEGLHGLSLRSAAQKAGVSHSAPYAHFKDKQALIAAISTRGLQQFYEEVFQISASYREKPGEQLYEVAWSYVEFALHDTGLFKIIFSSIIEREHDYPDFVAISHLNFELIVDIIKNNQKSGNLKQGDSTLISISIWSMVHGFISLYLEKQIPSIILQNYPTKELLKTILDQFITSISEE